MNISVLVFGSDNFLTTLPDQIRDTSTFNVEVIGNLNQGVSRIQITPPDILLVQASWDGSMELCSWLKEQTKLSWIYCILLEDRAQVLALKSQSDSEWESEMNAAALQQGADAYLWHQVRETSKQSSGELTPNQRLLLAQLTVGLRKAHKYRDLMRTNDLLSAIALADSLTQLNNRRALEWDLPRQIQKARAKGSSLSLIILDVDFFKRINDTYGHLVGDRLLQLLCTRIKHNLRFQDTPFRYGGEEFVIILSDTNCQEALLVAERINRIVGEQPFAVSNTLAINVTISLGTACLQPKDDDKGESLLNRADQYLLKAKASGRNCVIGCDRHQGDSEEDHPLDDSHKSHLQAISS
ncbi:MAG: diguanylate cyclase [Nostocaceae cyanobacterium]|nr:diguanylate cyclase [Nostocaceae cyanobacterium]